MAAAAIRRAMRRVVALPGPRRYVVDPVGIACNVSAVAVIALADYTAVAHTIVPWLGATSAPGAALLLGLVGLNTLMLWSFAKAVFGDPGTARSGGGGGGQSASTRAHTEAAISQKRPTRDARRATHAP